MPVPEPTNDKVPAWTWKVWIGTVIVLILAGIAQELIGFRIQIQSEPGGFKPIETIVQAGQEQRPVRVGPEIAWAIESNRPFLAYTVSDGSGITTSIRKFPARSFVWGGHLRSGNLVVRGIENDTRITFVFREVER